MKNIFLLILAISQSSLLFAGKFADPDSSAILNRLSGDACKCVDSILIVNKSKEELSKEISNCISKRVRTLQLFDKLMNASKMADKAVEVDGKKQINISINDDEFSDEFKTYYFKLERYMMKHCSSLYEKMAANNIINERSLSSNEKALEYYNKGLDAVKEENYKKAISYFKKAVKEDPQFAFAWDNLGINYRRLNDYDKAIECYKNSLDIDPYGQMPLQNIAVAYQYKKEYQKAIAAYEKLATVDKNNPEIYYGIGNIYALFLEDYEKGLQYMCKAYNMYLTQKSPFRADAEKVINMIYGEMKNKGKEATFNKILEENNISTDSKQ